MEVTLLHRIELHIALRDIRNSEDYLAVIENSPEETEKLYDDPLIDMLPFFRGPEASDYFTKNSIRGLVQNKATGETLRTLVPACATGEEAYPHAMLVVEEIPSLRKFVKLQIFASDVDDHALSVARTGIYTASIAADVHPAHLNRFYIEQDDTYPVVPDLRDAVVFADRSVLADALLSKLDPISCRKQLIYLTAETQNRITDLCHLARKDNGFLFLGLSETAKKRETRFQPISKESGMYRRTEKPRVGHLDFPITSFPTRAHSAPMRHRADMTNGLRLSDLSQELLRKHYAPAFVLANARLDVLFVEGPTHKYLKVPDSHASQDVLFMTRRALHTKSSSAIRRAPRTKRESGSSSPVQTNGAPVSIRKAVHPATAGNAPILLLTIRDQPAAPKRSVSEGAQDDRSRHINRKQYLCAA
jgi:two-component system CheB/CheR fusion protein